eukprot:TRINITY_DN4376_c0_g1_i1.p1 TRINITY_DN4376_c0_g1~~TRINITY_DN4376_c0_g1_i1.p1  ORF type:complete len:175 (-),score=24.56 TRINITY_DN4376_c0_g1_i1:248-772(-)
MRYVTNMCSCCFLSCFYHIVGLVYFFLLFFFFFFKQKTAYEMQRGLVGSEMCIRDRYQRRVHGLEEYCDSNEYFRIYNALTIKYYGNFPCLILDNSDLYGVAEQIMECGTTNVYYDVSNGTSISIKTVAKEWHRNKLKKSRMKSLLLRHLKKQQQSCSMFQGLCLRHMLKNFRR